ncbi:MAG: heavy metal translocating P-type ATPase, partial [Lachnospiraceae bacterium]|nr:heavy metal translocating P-type ATPase [Lachnospiraceae bacterium]
MTKKQKKVLIRIIITAVLVIAFEILTRCTDGLIEASPIAAWKNAIWFALYLIPYFVIGYDILKKAGKGILNRQVLD